MPTTHFIVHDKADNVGVIVVEDVKAGQTLTATEPAGPAKGFGPSAVFAEGFGEPRRSLRERGRGR